MRGVCFFNFESCTQHANACTSDMLFNADFADIPVSDSPTIFSLACFKAEREKRLTFSVQGRPVVHGRWTIHPPPKTTVQTPSSLLGVAYMTYIIFC